MGLFGRKISAEEGIFIVVVDTSFLIALQDADDRFHAEAMGHNLSADHNLIPIEIWTEYAQVLLRGGRMERARLHLENILAGPFHVESALEPGELPRVVAKTKEVLAWCAAEKRKPLTLFDVVVCWLAQRFKEGILTYDEGIKDAVRAKLFPGARIA